MKATLPVVLAAQFVIPMSISGTAIALPVIAGDLGDDPTPLQWVVNGFNLAFAVFTLVWGAVSDRVGHRTSFRIGVALTGVAGLASAFAPSLVLLDAARTVAGIGAAAVLVGSTSILSGAYTGAARGRAFAAFGTVNGLGLALGPTISGLLISGLGWRGVFLAQAAVLAVALIGTLVLPAIVSTRGDALDFHVLRDRRFLSLCLVPVAGAIGFVTLLTYLPGALSGVAEMTAGASGIFMLLTTLPVLVGPLVAARLIAATRATASGIIFVSLGCLVVGDLGMLALRPDLPVWLIALPMILVGLGFGLPIGLVDGEALAAVPAHLTGTAAGVLNFFRIGSEALAVAGYAWLLAFVVRRTVADPTIADATAAGRPGHPADYAQAFGVVAVTLAALVSVTALAVRRLSQDRRALTPVES